MKNLTPILLIVGFFIILTSFAVSAISINNTSLLPAITGTLDKINGNQDYLDFISKSSYHNVKLTACDDAYYFTYQNGSIQRANMIEVKSDITIRLSCFDTEKLAALYGDGTGADLRKFAMFAFSRAPFMARINVALQCLKTGWCRGKIL